MRVVLDIFRLIRFFNCLLTMMAVWVGAYMTWGDPIYYGPLLASVAAFLVCACGNCVNDLLDVEIDRVNYPHRVLAEGRLSKKFAVVVAVVCALGALIAAISVNWSVTTVVGLALVMLIAYNFKLKRVPLLGNVIIAVLSGLTFITGGLAINTAWTWELPGPLIPALFAVFLYLVREILKDVEGIDRDRRVGIRTFPQIIEPRSALATALVLFGVLVVLTIVPVLVGWFGSVYKIITVYIIDLPLLALLILIWGNPSPRMLAIGTFGLKVGMVLGIVALVLA
ncbi:MAG: geranylgeranylglycerol-phosphate geranylgeranyltransferase [candidate division Zixibacteria bacterium]|nr:geranylgeranylglycerol-phosphate geranylgeranyltransferase [candidate division Zixibacteria bacterium]